MIVNYEMLATIKYNRCQACSPESHPVSADTSRPVHRKGAAPLLGQDAAVIEDVSHLATAVDILVLMELGSP